MPIKSYILHYKSGKRDKILNDLEEINNCEVILSQNYEVVVLVTDTNSEESDIELYNKLIELEDLKHLSLVSGFDTK